MRYLYTFVLYCILPFLFLRLWWRSRHNVAYRERWLERLGIVSKQSLEQSIWLHAVSLGEVIAATPLIKALLLAYPTIPIVVTTTTPTGSAQVKAQFQDQVVQLYLPFDLPALLNRFLNHTKPKLGIIMETELWPNLLHACRMQKIPLLLANARLSPASAKGYNRVKSFVSEMLNSFSRVAAQSSLDGERFLQLGLMPEKLTLTGNVKFDLQLAPTLNEEALALRAQLGKERIIWIAASTHEGEENIILEAYRKLKIMHSALLLILVPRHADRFNKVANLCTEQGFKIARRSLKEIPMSETDIYLVDNFGEMMLHYAASNMAFVGGSLVPIGGHNLLEPAALALPLLSGPHLHNFTTISELLLKSNALIIVHDAPELIAAVNLLITNPHQANTMGAEALSVVDENRGAVERHMALVKEWLGSV